MASMRHNHKRNEDMNVQFLKPILLFLCVILVACASNEPEPFEYGAEQIQNAQVTSFPLQTSRESDDFVLLGETCDDVSLVNKPTVFEFEATAGIEYEVYFYPSTMSCQNMQLSLDAKTYIFDSQNRMVTNRPTNEQNTAQYTFTPLETGTYYFVIVPKYRDDVGGFSLTIRKMAGTQ